jgi:hypothetical protein
MTAIGAGADADVSSTSGQASLTRKRFAGVAASGSRSRKQLRLRRSLADFDPIAMSGPATAFWPRRNCGRASAPEVQNFRPLADESNHEPTLLKL